MRRGSWPYVVFYQSVASAVGASGAYFTPFNHNKRDLYRAQPPPNTTLLPSQRWIPLEAND